MKAFKTLLYLSIFLSAGLVSVQAQTKKQQKDTWNYRYEIQCAGTGTDGTYMVKVWCYSKQKKLNPQQAGQCAVHGIIFKGVTGGLQGCASQPALARDPSLRETHKDFFQKFFASAGDWNKYVLSVGTKVDRIKTKGAWKYGVTVQVAKDQLRKDLEAAGVIKGLSSGF
ncbi:MAG: hypothetical protein NC048_01880 [Bacteroides sp.]|nr:hypothetical protein [Ruminococcus flavefaciens]MCM1554228.1 hypothetical protein [Bacteroides sp.]